MPRMPRPALRSGKSFMLSGRLDSCGRQISRKPLPTVAPMDASSAQCGGFSGRFPSAKACWPSRVSILRRVISRSSQSLGTNVMPSSVVFAAATPYFFICSRIGAFSAWSFRLGCGPNLMCLVMSSCGLNMVRRVAIVRNVSDFTGSMERLRSSRACATDECERPRCASPERSMRRVAPHLPRFD